MWLDQLRRGMIEGGELARMVEEDSLRGVTSNPAIFEKAILGSPDYDDDLAAAAREGLSARARSTAAWRCATCSSPPTCCARSTSRRGG